MSCGKTDELIEMPFWGMDSGGAKKAGVGWGHIDATWRIRFNRSYAGGDAVYCEITLTTCFVLRLCNNHGC